MKRLGGFLLTVMLCLSLFGCAGAAKPDDPTITPPVPETAETAEESAEPMTLDALNVEFAVGDRDAAPLLEMQKSFPAVFMTALDGQNVIVKRIDVTFGTSGEATETALRSGAVQLAFLTAEDYFPYRSGLIVAAERSDAPDLAQGLIVLATSDDAAADERLAGALREALPELADVLASYTEPTAGGVYEYDAARIEALSALYEKENMPT